jgi:hypothetical protein
MPSPPYVVGPREGTPAERRRPRPPLRDRVPAVKNLSLEEKIGLGFWIGVVLFMLSQILLVVFAIAFFLGHFVWPQ